MIFEIKSVNTSEVDQSDWNYSNWLSNQVLQLESSGIIPPVLLVINDWMRLKSIQREIMGEVIVYSGLVDRSVILQFGLTLLVHHVHGSITFQDYLRL